MENPGMQLEQTLIINYVPRPENFKCRKELNRQCMKTRFMCLYLLVYTVCQMNARAHNIYWENNFLLSLGSC